MMKLPTLLSLTLIGFFWATDPVDNDKPKWLGDLPRDCLELVDSFNKSSVRRCCMCSLAMLKTATEFGTINEVNRMIERCRSDNFSYFSSLNDKEKEELVSKLESFKKHVEQNADLFIKYAGAPFPTEGYDYERLQTFDSYEKMFKDIRVREDDFSRKQNKYVKELLLAFRSRIEDLSPLITKESQIMPEFPNTPSGTSFNVIIGGINKMITNQNLFLSSIYSMFDIFFKLECAP